MQFIYSIFNKESHLTTILKKQTIIDIRTNPKQLIKELKSGQLSKFISIINQEETVPLITMRKYTLLHYVLLHCPQMYEQFQEVNLKIRTSDEWLNQYVISPYTSFLYKIINSNGMYGQCKMQGIIDISFRKLFYIVNTLKELFPCVKKMSNLSRYYSVTEKQLQTQISTDYVFAHAYEAQDLYNSFKAILSEMISKPDKYLTTETDQEMMRYILEDVVVKLNQDMKNLFLDKYFFPYGKGYGVKLFREDELTGDSKDFVEKLYEMKNKRKEKKKKMTLDRILFDQSGHLNPQIYQTLTQIRQGDQSLRDVSFNSEIAPRKSKRSYEQELTEQI